MIAELEGSIEGGGRVLVRTVASKSSLTDMRSRLYMQAPLQSSARLEFPAEAALRAELDRMRREAAEGAAQGDVTTAALRLWKSVHGLHAHFGKSDRADDLIGSLLMAKREWSDGPLPPGAFDVVLGCLEQMVREPHTAELVRTIDVQLAGAGVDLRGGF